MPKQPVSSVRTAILAKGSVFGVISLAEREDAAFTASLDPRCDPAVFITRFASYREARKAADESIAVSISRSCSLAYIGPPNFG